MLFIVTYNLILLAVTIHYYRLLLIITNNCFFLIDDSIDNFSEKISFLHWENDELDSEENRKYLCDLLLKSMPK